MQWQHYYEWRWGWLARWYFSMEALRWLGRFKKMLTTVHLHKTMLNNCTSYLICVRSMEFQMGPECVHAWKRVFCLHCLKCNCVLFMLHWFLVPLFKSTTHLQYQIFLLELTCGKPQQLLRSFHVKIVIVFLSLPYHVHAALDEQGGWRKKKTLWSLLAVAWLQWGSSTKGALFPATAVRRFICHHPSDPFCLLIRRRLQGCSVFDKEKRCKEQRLRILCRCVPVEKRLWELFVSAGSWNHTHCLRSHQGW